MFSSQSAEVSVGAPCRAIEAVPADTSARQPGGGVTGAGDDEYDGGLFQSSVASPMSWFLLGSHSTTKANHLHLIRYHPELNELGLEASMLHSTGPVNAIASCPTDPSLVITAAATIADNGDDHSVQLWSLPPGLMNRAESSIGDESYSDEGTNRRGTTTSHQLQPVATLSRHLRDDHQVSPVVDVRWRSPSSMLADDFISSSAQSAGDVVTIDRQGTVHQWDLSHQASASLVRTVNIRETTSRFTLTPPRVCWDPHSANGSMLAVTDGGGLVQILDWRVDTSVPTGTVSQFRAQQRSGGVTDLDYNPNKPYVLATAGQDGLVKFWDLRRLDATRPLLVTRGGHSHWTTRVRYNPCHDQLVLSAGTDAVANLWRVSSISSAPMLVNTNNNSYKSGQKKHGGSTKSSRQKSSEVSGENEPNHDGIESKYPEGHAEQDDTSAASSGDEDDDDAPNVRVSRHEYSDAVYGICWSLVDEWTYVAASYDGKVTLHHVPSNEKYKILL
jgi:EARP and GARP complex-interacting protein 1